MLCVLARERNDERRGRRSVEWGGRPPATGEHNPHTPVRLTGQPGQGAGEATCCGRALAGVPLHWHPARSPRAIFRCNTGPLLWRSGVRNRVCASCWAVRDIRLPSSQRTRELSMFCGRTRRRLTPPRPPFELRRDRHAAQKLSPCATRERSQRRRHSAPGPEADTARGHQDERVGNLIGFRIWTRRALEATGNAETVIRDVEKALRDGNFTVIRGYDNLRLRRDKCERSPSALRGGCRVREPPFFQKRLAERGRCQRSGTARRGLTSPPFGNTPQTKGTHQ